MNLLEKIQTYFSGECDSCEKKSKIRIPIAGSGVQVAYLCIPCIEERQIRILPEFIERFNVRTESL